MYKNKGCTNGEFTMKNSEVWSCKENLQKGFSEEAELPGFRELQLHFVPYLVLYNFMVEIFVPPGVTLFFFKIILIWD